VFEPPIHWHYAGRLRHALLEKTTRAYVGELIRALQEDGDQTILLSPVHLGYRHWEAINQAFKAAGVKVHAAQLQGVGTVDRSTVSRQDEGSLRLATATMDLETEAALARHRIAQAAAPPASTKHWGIRHLLGHRPASPQSSNFVRLRQQGRSLGAKTILVDPAERPREKRDTIAHAQKLMQSLNAICEEDTAVRMLPLPNLDRDELLHLIETLPSKILDGSSEHEQALERGIATAAAESAEGFLGQTLWRALKRGVGPDSLSSSEFWDRLKQLDPEIARSHPWSTLFDLWAHVLRGLDSDREYSARWLNRIRALPPGPVSFDDIDDIFTYEAAIYGIYCERDRSKLSYLVVYHGSRWYLGRVALASMFGGGGGGAPSAGGLTWDS
jgi:hypothetical protein